MCENSKCPIIQAIKSTYVGDNEDTNVVKGGNDMQFISDNMIYYTTYKKIEIARLSLTDFESAEYTRKYKQLFGSIAGKSYQQIYEKHINETMSPILYNNINDLLALVNKMEDLVMLKLINNKRTLNLTLPTFEVEIDKTDMYDPEKITNIVNQLVSRINILNINTLLSAPINSNITKSEIKLEKPQWFGKDRSIRKLTSATMADINNAMKAEQEILDYLILIERHYAGLANKIYEAIQICKKIVDNIIIN